MSSRKPDCCALEASYIHQPDTMDNVNCDAFAVGNVTDRAAGNEEFFMTPNQ